MSQDEIAASPYSVKDVATSSTLKVVNSANIDTKLVSDNTRGKHKKEAKVSVRAQSYRHKGR